MLVVSDYQLALAHAEPNLSGMVHFERGEYRQQVGESDAALEEYTRCVDLCQRGALVEKAKSRVQSLRGDTRGTALGVSRPARSCRQTGYRPLTG